MDILNKWVTLIANVGVLIGIIFLAFELQQANRIAIATTEMGVREGYKSIQEAAYNIDVARMLAKATEEDPGFSPEEEQMAYGYVFSWVNLWIGIETAYQRGMVPEITFELAKQDMPATIPYYIGLKSYWQDALVDYPAMEDFQLIELARKALDEAGIQSTGNQKKN